jgi:hypothetical protein
LDIQLNGFIMHTGEHLLYHAKNQTGSTIAKGVPVMFAGTDGNSGKLLIQPWNGTGPSTYFMGLTAEEFINDEEGFVIAFGKLRGIQTNGGNYSQTWTNGEIIYAGTTTGSLTDSAPAAPNPRIQVAAVISAHASNGTLFVRPVYGSNIKDDEGVTITSLTTGNILVATSGGSTGVFENKAMSGDATLASTGALTIANNAVSYAKMQDVSAASKLIGRGDSGSGDPQEITLGTGLSMTGTTLAVTVTDTGITQLTGDVTAGPGSGSQAATIANDAVTNAKLANMAQATIKGRASGAGTGDPTDLTGTQATAILDNFVGDSGSGGTKGLVPAPAAGDAAAGKYLDSDGTWSVPPSSGVSDGDKGDITVSSSGTVWTIDNGVVTYAKMQDVSAASRLLGRGSASGSGDPEEITIGSGLSMSGTTLSATGGGGGATYEQVASDVAITNNSVFQDITGMSFTAAANTDYLIRINFSVTTSATSTGYEIGLNGPASPTGYFSIVSLWNSAVAETATITDSTSYGSIGSNVNAGGATARPAIGTILFRNGSNSGTVQIQGKVETGATGTVTFKANSFITWETVTT